MTRRKLKISKVFGDLLADATRGTISEDVFHPDNLRDLRCKHGFPNRGWAGSRERAQSNSVKLVFFDERNGVISGGTLGNESQRVSGLLLLAMGIQRPPVAN